MITVQRSTIYLALTSCAFIAVANARKLTVSTFNVKPNENKVRVSTRSDEHGDAVLESGHVSEGGQR